MTDDLFKPEDFQVVGDPGLVERIPLGVCDKIVTVANHLLKERSVVVYSVTDSGGDTIWAKLDAFNCASTITNQARIFGVEKFKNCEHKTVYSMSGSDRGECMLCNQAMIREWKPACS